jgi:hypothetical protein
MQSTTNANDKFQLPTLPFSIPLTDPTNNRDFSYFFPFLQQIISKFDQFPKLSFINESTLPLEYHSSIHPKWTNWNEIWSTPPIIINTSFSSKPIFEFMFQSALFRIQLSSAYFLHTREKRKIRQGTTFVFKGYEDSEVRFVVEWCQMVNHHDAYLKLVGMNDEGGLFPWSDPDFPSFILIVPFCIVEVPSPPNISLCYSLPFDSKQDERDFSICWACKRAFDL